MRARSDWPYHSRIHRSNRRLYPVAHGKASLRLRSIAMAAGDPKFYPTTSGVSFADLGAAVVPLARNLASIQVRGLRAQSPVFASWTVTLACNLGCAHFSFNRPLPDELPHAERLEVAHRLARSTAWGVSLIGGEPLLVKQLFEYARFRKAAGKRVFLGTSGGWGSSSPRSCPRWTS